MKTSFLPSFAIPCKEKVQTKRVRNEFKIPEKKSGELAVYLIMSLFIFLFLSVFMEFPSLHMGKTYIEKNGKLIEVTKPIFHTPFNFKGYHIAKPYTDHRLVKSSPAD